MKCLPQGYIVKKWQTWDFKPGSQVQVYTPNHSALLLPVCFTPGRAHLLPFLPIPHSSHELSLNHLLSSMFPSSSCVRLDPERRQDRRSPGPCPPFFLAWMRRVVSATGVAGAGVVAPTRRLTAKKQAAVGSTELRPQWYLAPDRGGGWEAWQVVSDEQRCGGWIVSRKRLRSQVGTP